MSNANFSYQEGEIRRGMKDLVVDSTKITFVDGVNGELYYRGINIAELAAHASFEEVAFLLLCGYLPSKQELDSFSWSLRQTLRSQEKVLRLIAELPQTTPPLSTLQMGLAALACLDMTERFLEYEEENLIKSSIRIIAQTSVILSASYRHYLGVPVLDPSPELSFVENLIYMLFGKIPTKKQTRCLEIALIVQMDHGFTSSSFTARTVASTLTNLYSATSAAIGALSGPMHGGASVLVEDMLQDAQSSGDVRQYARDLLQSGGRIMGMGHRVYKAVDPRARILYDLLMRLAENEKNPSDIEALKAIEEEARLFFEKGGLPVFVNVDFWNGAVYKRLGFEPILYPAIFAVARMVGYCAHIVELRQDNKLYRPSSHYVGDLNIPYVPIEQR